MTRKRRLPEGLEKHADQAGLEMLARPSAPRVMIRKTKTGWQFDCPYAPEDEERWQNLLFQAFGTRHGSVVNAFFDAFARICGDRVWDEKRNVWLPDEDEFNSILAIVAAHKPQNEAEAAHAMQLAALHLVSMKVGERASRYAYDTRTVATFAKLVRVSGEGLERIARLQGRLKAKTINQTIQVVYCDNRSVSLSGGAGPFRGQPHAASHAAAATGLPALPSPCSNYRATVPATRREGQASVQNACGARGSGAPSGEASGSWKHGGWTREAVDLRRKAAELMRAIRNDAFGRESAD
jgi:hypothetical protein